LTATPQELGDDHRLLHLCSGTAAELQSLPEGREVLWQHINTGILPEKGIK